MSVRSSGSSVNIRTAADERHTTWLRSADFGAVTFRRLPPYLEDISERNYLVHPSGLAWTYTDADGRYRILPSNSVRQTNVDGYVYYGIEVVTDADGRVWYALRPVSTDVDGKVGFGQEVSVNVDGKILFPVRIISQDADGRVAFSLPPFSTDVDGKVIFPKGPVSLDADGRVVFVHISDLQWVADFIAQYIPQIRSSSQVSFTAYVLNPRQRVEILFVGDATWTKNIVVIGNKVFAYEFVNHWRLLGASGDEVTVFSCSSSATKGRTLNLSNQQRIVVFVSYH